MAHLHFPQMADDFQPDQTVFAKVAGFPFWPAKASLAVDCLPQVEAENDLPPHVLKQKPSPTTQKQFLKGLDDIKDLSKWPAKGQFDNYDQLQELAAGELDFDDDDGEPEMKKRRKSSSAVEGGAEKKKRKRNTEDPSELKRKVEKSRPEVSPKDRLLKLRMKLQLFLQQKDPYQKTDYEKANGYLTETEKVEMDVTLFRETKIGKVIKHLSKKGLTEFDISARCKKLTEKWISELQDTLVSATGTAEGDMPSVGPEHNEALAADTKMGQSPVKGAISPTSPKRTAVPVAGPTLSSPKKEHPPVSPKKAAVSPKLDAAATSPKNPNSPKKSPQMSPKKSAPVSPSKAALPAAATEMAPASPRNIAHLSPKKAAASPKMAPVSPSKILA
ncbi:hypothetical protein HDU91_003150 [Kappamyces sp. JEL0680]|nr:hypothetical protein HDU91_003150 [Kappamyces sp. JEL0680]